MARQATTVGVVLLALAVAVGEPGSTVEAQVLPVEKMQEAIAQDVDYLLSQQGPDGSWRYSAIGTGYDPIGIGYDTVGCTALCTLALRHSGLTRAIAPARKGLAFVVQQPPEARTYTAGLVNMLLYETGDKRNQGLINAYATMVIHSQNDEGKALGTWSHYLETPNSSGVWPRGRGAGGDGDMSNTEFAALALHFAERTGLQVPMGTWQSIKGCYELNQHADGGWAFRTIAGAADRAGEGPGPTQDSGACMTVGGVIGLSLAEETLQARSGPHVCKMVPETPAVVKGVDWLAAHPWNDKGPYLWYALELREVLSGHSELGGKDWLEEGTKSLLESNHNYGGERTRLPDTALAVLFLSRALEPVTFNKLKRAGDWNDDPDDIKHLTEFMTEKYSMPRRWRIVSLEVPVDSLLRVPILYMNGHDALSFTADEKAKLKEYVKRGGTIFGMACCGSKVLDKSFRELCAELWPEAPLTEVAKNHALFQYPRRNQSPPHMFAMTVDPGRLGVIYSPKDLCCAWSMGGKAGEPAYPSGVNVAFYVEIVAVRHGAVKAGGEVVKTGGDGTGAEPGKENPAAHP